MEGTAPFEDYPSLIRFLTGNMRRKKDNTIGVHGPEGVGKSTIAMNIALDLDPFFDPARDAIFTVEEYLRHVIEQSDPAKPRGWSYLTCLQHRDVRLEQEGPCPHCGVALVRRMRVRVVDEAVNLIYARNFNTVENKGLAQITMQDRILRSTTIYCIPQFPSFDPYFRDRFNLRIYAPPSYDADGMKPDTSRVLWRSERFDYVEQEVRYSWEDVFDLEVHSLDGHPTWDSYEARKIGGVHNDARALLARLTDKAKSPNDKAPRVPKGRRARGRPSPPTTT